MRILLLFVLITSILCHTAEEWSSRTIYFMLTDRFARTGGQGGGGCDNWKDFCGGTFQGLRSRLDYIQGMGFDAIWITPPIENTDGGYHGYWAKDFNQIEDKLGGATELLNLVNAAHARGMWVMVGAVANHVGPIGTDYGQISPFNSADHYHPECQISNYVCFTNEVYTCRLAGLPDLNQDNSYVSQQLQSWISKLVSSYGFDGVRSDTVMYITSPFWKSFRSAANVFMIGEVFSDQSCNVAYIDQGAVDATLDYPNSWIIKNVFGGQQSLKGLDGVLSNWNQFPQNGRYQATFLDNHDNPRFLNVYPNKITQLKNAIVWLMFSTGIPIIYYGTEQGFSGGADPANREPLWSSNYNTNSDLYIFINATINARKNLKPWTYSFATKYSADQVYAWQKGNTLIVVSNQNYNIKVTIGGLSIASGTVLNDQLLSGFSGTVENGQITVTLTNGLPLVLSGGSGPTPDKCTVSNRVDCGYVGINQQQCEAKGCCWIPSPTSGVPWCYFANNATLVQ